MNVNRGVVEKQNTGSEKLPGMNLKKPKSGESSSEVSCEKSLSTFPKLQGFKAACVSLKMFQRCPSCAAVYSEHHMSES